MSRMDNVKNGKQIGTDSRTEKWKRATLNASKRGVVGEKTKGIFFLDLTNTIVPPLRFD
jgi:hypothetical protein